MTEDVLQLALHRNATVVENAMRAYYTDDEDIASLLNSERYSLFAGGKRIRPTLTLEFCKLFGRKADKIRKLYNGMIPCYFYQFFKNDKK